MSKRNKLAVGVREVISSKRTSLPLLSAAILGIAVAATFPDRDVLATANEAKKELGVGLPASFADLVDVTRPSVVGIMTRGDASARAMPPALRGLPPGHPFHRFFGDNGSPDQQVRGMGSGFVIDAAGLIVTNHHVIDGAKEIKVVLHDGRELTAKRVGSDSKTDLAVLKVDAGEPLTAARFGDSDKARVGDWVVAVGSPFGLGGSYTAGIISARGRDIRSGPYDDYLQIDAPINRGNSGGALFNTRGEVIGVNTAIYSPNGGNVGIGFAVPADIARAVIEDLSDDGIVERGWLGVQIQALTKAMASSLGLDAPKGALVANVEKASPAARAGIRVGDVVLEVDGQSVDRMRDLPRLVAGIKNGEEVPVKVWRRGDHETLNVKMGALPGAQVADAAGSAAPDVGPQIGLVIAPLDNELRARFRIRPETSGVVIVDVQRGSPAAKLGLRPGMVIEMVSQQPVASPDEVKESLAQARAEQRDAVLLLVADQAGNRRFLALALS